jgi:hypothetical protein
MGNTPPEECRQLVGAYCSKMVECALPSDRSRAAEDCEFDFEVNLSCDDVIRIAGSMPTCLSDLSAIQCTTVDPPGSFPALPSSCKILVHR